MIKCWACGQGHFRTPPECTIEKRFWGHVEKNGPDACWLYAPVDRLGYGQFQARAPYRKAHRCAWIFTHGQIAEGLDVCHKCDVRNCCNPAHLFLGTHIENMRDQHAKGRHTKGEMNGQNVLTEAQVLDIRAKYKRTGGRGRYSGNMAELARLYPNAKRTTIYHAAVGNTWKHLK